MQPRLELIKLIKSTRTLFDGFGEMQRTPTRRSSNDPTTPADIKVANHLVEGIKSLFPSDNVIVEDGKGVQNNSDITWVINPIDGTIPFIYGIPTYIVSIYRIKNNKVNYALTYSPVLDYVYESGDGITSLNSQVLAVSNTNQLNDAIVVIPSYAPFAIPGIQKKMEDNGIRVIFQEGLIFRSNLVASGYIDATIQPTLKMYESGAVILTIENAGGIVAGFTGEKPQLMQTNQNIIISNKNLYPSLSTILQDLV